MSGIPLPTVPRGGDDEFIDAIEPRVEAPRLAEAVPAETTEVDAVSQERRAAVREVVAEYPTHTREVASFSPESAKALKVELGLSDKDLLVGIPQEVADALKLGHGDTVKLTIDGKSLFLGERNIRVVTRTPKGSLSKVGLSKGIRSATGLQDHRETKSPDDKGDNLPFTIARIDGQNVLWLQVDKKVAPGSATATIGGQ